MYSSFLQLVLAKRKQFVAPLVDRYLTVMRSGTGCTVLYVTPTRALANDLLRRLQPSLDRLGVSVGIRHGERNDFPVRASRMF